MKNLLLILLLVPFVFAANSKQGKTIDTTEDTFEDAQFLASNDSSDEEGDDGGVSDPQGDVDTEPAPEVETDTGEESSEGSEDPEA